MSHDPSNPRMINSSIPRQAGVRLDSGFKISMGDGAVAVQCDNTGQVAGQAPKKMVTLQAIGDDAIAQLSYIFHTFLNTRAEDTPPPWIAVSDILKFGSVLDQNSLLDYYSSLAEGSNEFRVRGEVLDKKKVADYNARQESIKRFMTEREQREAAEDAAASALPTESDNV